MPELATIPVGADQGDLPPINLPSLDVPQEKPRLRITVGAKPAPEKTADPYAGFTEYQAPAESSTAAKADDPYAGFKEYTGEEEPKREVGTGEAALKGLTSGFSFGLTPALQGVMEAGGKAAPDETGLGGLGRMAMGGAKLLHNAFSGHPDPEVKAAYDRGRQAALKDEQAAQEQHPAAFFAGQMAGSMAMPIGGAATAAATLPARLGRGAVQGAIGGGLYGGGSAISQGQGLPDVARSAATNAAIGAPLGGAISGAIGPRLVNAASPGQRAAATAEGLGVPLARGLASDNAAVNATTAKMRSVPVVGSRISSDVDRLQHAAGERIGGIAEQMSGGTPSRSVADAMVRPGFQHVIDTNNRTVDAGYNALRGQIDQTQRFTMPRTDALLTQIMRDRHAAGWANPAQGLEQFRNVAGGATFNGAHRARVDARNAGNVTNPNPGYNAADFNRITRAMTADLRAMTQAAARNQTPQGRQAAVNAFDQAERQFGPIAEQNRLLNRLMNAQGEGAISKVLGAAKERSGNLRLLAQLRNSMPAADFEQIGGTLLHELGWQPSTGQFSLAKFATEWQKTSAGAGRVLFSPQHLQNINDIAGLGQHIKQALRESNTSHTAGVIVMFDLARDAIMLGIGIGTGAVTAGAAMSGGLAMTPAVLLTHWLASPATSASMAAWVRAYRGALSGSFNASRMAAFNVATRNLANNLGVPVNKILAAAQRQIGGGKAEPDQPQ